MEFEHKTNTFATHSNLCIGISVQQLTDCFRTDGHFHRRSRRHRHNFNRFSRLRQNILNWLKLIWTALRCLFWIEYNHLVYNTIYTRKFCEIKQLTEKRKQQRQRRQRCINHVHFIPFVTVNFSPVWHLYQYKCRDPFISPQLLHYKHTNESMNNNNTRTQLHIYTLYLCHLSTNSRICCVLKRLLFQSEFRFCFMRSIFQWIFFSLCLKVPFFMQLFKQLNDFQWGIKFRSELNSMRMGKRRNFFFSLAKRKKRGENQNNNLSFFFGAKTFLWDIISKWMMNMSTLFIKYIHRHSHFGSGSTLNGIT